MGHPNRMKAILFVLAIVATASAFPLLSLKANLKDIPSCVTDLKNDFDDLESAIDNKDWSQVANLIKNISKSYVDCKDAKNQIDTCITYGKAVVSDIADIVNAVIATI